MAIPQAQLAEIDPVWSRIRSEAEEAVAAEPLMGGLIHSGVLHHKSFACALAYRLSLKLASDEMPAQILREIVDGAYGAEPELVVSARADLVATYERDPACHRFLQPLFYFKGYQAIQPTGSVTGSGCRAGSIWPISCRCACPRPLASTSIRRPRSAAA